MSTRKSTSKPKSASTSPPTAGSTPRATRPTTTALGPCSPRTCWPGCRPPSPKPGNAIEKNHGAHAAETLLTRLRDQIDQRGTLDVLRHGIEMLGLREPLTLAQFKPALAINPDILARYAANRLRVVRQVRYSLHNENCIDLVLFLNGMPVATVELKTDFTQSVGDAIDQYRFDRHPKPKGQARRAAAVLSQRGAGAFRRQQQRSPHDDASWTARDSVFLPFNQGDNGGAGNPVNPNGGHRTAYLWEQVWARESWLEILGRYLVAQKDKKKQIDEDHLPPLPPARRDAKAPGRRARAKGRAANT